MAWTELTLAGNAVTNADVKFQIFAGDGSKIGEPTVANTTAAGAHQSPRLPPWRTAVSS